MASNQEYNCTTQETTLSTSPPNRLRFDLRNNWFDSLISEWEKYTESLRKSSTLQPIRILEIGAFEGGSTTWILDNLTTHPDSTMIVVDTFAGGMEHTPEEVESLEERFYANVNKCSNVTKLRVMKTKSEDALPRLRMAGAKFDFIYIDASHVAIDVLHDAVMCWHMLPVGGMLVFDDWTWKGYNEDFYNPRMAIMGFLQCAAPEIEVQETESQMWVTRIRNVIPATPNPDSALFYWDSSERFLLKP